MIIQYISTMIRAEDFAELFTDKTKMPGQQGQKYNRLLAEGLAENGITVEVCAGVPITSGNYPHKFYPGKRIPAQGMIWRYFPVINIPVIKNLHQMCNAFLSALKGAKEDVVIVDVLNASIACGASVGAKLRGKRCVGIVTDLPQLMVTGTNEKHIKMVNGNIKRCTHYVLLTEQMKDAVNPEGKPYVIIEGICDGKMKEYEAIQKASVKKVLYAGYLDARYGVKNMVDAFLLANPENAQMHIYGNGPYAQELTEIAEKNNNVVYYGNVLNEEVVKAELNATLLVNPRPTHEEFTKYSFPSKNMEYMASGTPVLTTKLPGMPEAYWDKVFLFDDESVAGMAKTYQKVLSLSECQRAEVGKKAKEFVLTQKNGQKQAEKLIDLLCNRSV